MKINTKYLGQVEINPDQIIHFPKGLLGFENHKEYVVLDLEGNDVFKFLQNIQEEYISFLLVNPWDFFHDYDIELADNKLEKININPREENEFALFSIVSLGESFKESTANLLAPIVINTKDKKGKQFVVHDSAYTTKHPLFPEGV